MIHHHHRRLGSRARLVPFTFLPFMRDETTSYFNYLNSHNACSGSRCHCPFPLTATKLIFLCNAELDSSVSSLFHNYELWNLNWVVEYSERVRNDPPTSYILFELIRTISVGTWNGSDTIWDPLLARCYSLGIHFWLRVGYHLRHPLVKYYLMCHLCTLNSFIFLYGFEPTHKTSCQSKVDHPFYAHYSHLSVMWDVRVSIMKPPLVV